VEGNHGTIRFVRQVAFKGDRSVLVSEDPIRAEIQRTSSGWRIVNAVLDDEPTTVAPAGTGTAEVTEAAFAHEVLESSLPVLVHFGAEWSAPCRELTRTLAAIAVEHPQGLTIRRVTVTRSGPLATKYGVKAVPTMLLFESGEMRSQLVGNVPKVEIEQFLRANESAIDEDVRVQQGLAADRADALKVNVSKFGKLTRFRFCILPLRILISLKG
jgi:thioredoxin 1